MFVIGRDAKRPDSNGAEKAGRAEWTYDRYGNLLSYKRYSSHSDKADDEEVYKYDCWEFDTSELSSASGSHTKDTQKQ